MDRFYLIDSPSFARLEKLKDEYSNLDITSVLLYLEIQKAYKKMKLNHDELLKKFDLSEAKFTIIMLLSYERDMMLSPSSLSEKIGSKKSTISGVLKGLEKSGLVRRKVLSEDKRTSYVQLTDYGLRKLKEFLPDNYEVVSKIFEVFSEDEKEQFYKLANKLKNHLEKGELF